MENGGGGLRSAGRVFRRRGGLLIRDPGDKQARPVFHGIGDLHAHARGAIDSRRNPDDGGRRLGRRAVRPVRANVEFLSDADLLIQMEQRARSRDVVSFSGLAPGSAVVRAARNNDRQTQRHPQRETSLFILVGRAHYSRHSLFIAPKSLSTCSGSISLLRRFWLVPVVKT